MTAVEFDGSRSATYFGEAHSDETKQNFKRSHSEI